MIDWGRIEELRDEVGEDDLIEVIELFCEEMGEVLERLPSAPQNDLLGHIHFLKGSAQNIGVCTVADMCKSIEEAIGNDPGFAPDISGLNSAFAESSGALLQKFR